MFFHKNAVSDVFCRLAGHKSGCLSFESLADWLASALQLSRQLNRCHSCLAGSCGQCDESDAGISTHWQLRQLVLALAAASQRSRWNDEIKGSSEVEVRRLGLSL